jgi:hypothetical protein
MKIIVYLLIMAASVAMAFSQSTPTTITLPPSQKENPPHFYRKGNGTLYVSFDGGHKWNKVGQTILEDKEMITSAKFVTISPNPMKFNGVITLNLQETGAVEIVLMTVEGKLLRTIVSGTFNAGTRSWDIDTSQLVSGVYICSITVAGKTTRSLFTVQK